MDEGIVDVVEQAHCRIIYAVFDESSTAILLCMAKRLELHFDGHVRLIHNNVFNARLTLKT